MHYCFVWKKWQWLVSPWMEANLCLNTGGCRLVRGGLSGGRWRGQAVYWELDQWQVNPHWGKLFIFVKAFLLHSHGGPRQRRRATDPSICKGNVVLWTAIFLPRTTGTGEKIFAWACFVFVFFEFITRFSLGCNKCAFVLNYWMMTISSLWGHKA